MAGSTPDDLLVIAVNCSACLRAGWGYILHVSNSLLFLRLKILHCMLFLGIEPGVLCILGKHSTIDYILFYIHTYMYSYICVYTCIYMCVCVCVDFFIFVFSLLVDILFIYISNVILPSFPSTTPLYLPLPPPPSTLLPHCPSIPPPWVINCF